MVHSKAREPIQEEWLSRGDTLYGKQKYEDAIKCYEKALEINPKNSRALNDIGNAYYNLGNYSDAIEYFDKALELDPKDPIALRGKGYAHYDLEDYREAIECFDKALQIVPKDAYALDGMGNAHYILKNYSDATRYYDKALQINSKDAYALSGMGASLAEMSSLGKLEKYDDAVKSLKHALEINPELVFARYSLGKTYGRLEDFSGALDEFRKITDQDSRTHNNIGLCYHEQGLYVQAEKEYFEALKSDPKLAEPYYNLAVLYNSEKKQSSAQRLLETCLNIERDFSKARAALKKLEGPEHLDWYQWWFGNGKHKKILGGGLLCLIFALILMTAYGSLISANVTGLAVSSGVLVVMLLLPSLKKAKVGVIELETELASANPVLKPSLA